jgi:hypothetical protein
MIDHDENRVIEKVGMVAARAAVREIIAGHGWTGCRSPAAAR